MSSIPQGTHIFRIEGVLVESPRQHTIQIGHRAHILPEGRMWGMMNHSCEPNCRIEFATWSVVAVRAIPAGDEITFNYLTTEWGMSAPFHCLCGSPRCFGHIRGFAYLSPGERESLAPFLSPYLLSRWRGPSPDGALQGAIIGPAMLPVPIAASTLMDGPDAS